MRKPSKTGKAEAAAFRPEAERSGPSVRRIEPGYELVFSRFVGKLERLAAPVIGAEDKPKRTKGRRL